MRKIFQQLLFVSLLTTALVACLKPEDKPPVVEPPIDETPIKSAFGTPVGSAFTQTIDATGGTFSEVTTGVTVKAFAGTVDSSAQIKVQPITNTLPDGIGMGVEISSNQPLRKSLIVRFSYDASEPDPNSLRLAMQADDGSWFSLAPVKIDSVNKTVSAALPDSLPVAANGSSQVKPMGGLKVKRVVKYLGFYMKPKSATVKVGKSVEFVPYARVLVETTCPPSPPPVDGDELASVCPQRMVKEYPFTNDKAGFSRAWSLNGAAGGDSKNGYVKASASVGATYTAPEKAPSPSTVTVSFETTDTQTRQKLVILANVEVVGTDYKVVGDYSQKGFGACNPALGTADLSGHVEFNLIHSQTTSDVFTIEAIQNQATKNENFKQLIQTGGLTQDTPVQINLTSGDGDLITGDVGINLEGTIAIGNCTQTLPEGSIPYPGITSEWGGAISFPPDAFVNDTLTAPTRNFTFGTWVFKVTRF